MLKGGTEAWRETVPGSDSTTCRLQTPAHPWPSLAKGAQIQFPRGRGRGRTGGGMSPTQFGKSPTLFYNSSSPLHLTCNLYTSLFLDIRGKPLWTLILNTVTCNSWSSLNNASIKNSPFIQFSALPFGKSQLRLKYPHAWSSNTVLKL